MNRKTSDDFITITDLWHIYVSHWQWFVLSLALCLGYGIFYLVRTPNMFVSEAAILIKDESAGKSATRTPGGDEFNELGMLSQRVNVVNVQRQLSSLEYLVEVVRRRCPGIALRDAIGEAEDLRDRLKTEIESDKSTIINLRYTDYSPQNADQVLSTIIQVYNDKWIEDKHKVTANTSNFITERLTLLEHELGVVDDSISAYKRRHKITDLERVSDIYLEQQSQSDAEILRLTNQKAMAQYILDMLRDKSEHQQLLPTNSGLNNAVAEAQITHYNTMLLQLRSNLYGTSRQNPLIRQQEDELQELRKNVLSTIANHIKTLDIQLQAILGYNGEANSRITSNPNQAKHLVSVEREQKVKESLYLYLLQKKEENEINKTYTSEIMQVVDMPHGSMRPSSPNQKNVLFASLLLGLLVPGIFLFVRASLDTTVRDKYDVERHTSLTLIGEVPFVAYKRRRWWPLSRKRSEAEHRSHMVAVAPDKQDLANEAFRLIRSNMEFMMGKHGERNIYLITSYYEGSGKTFVGVNLSLALAIKGRRVLFIDGDFRRATASRVFHWPSVGIADYLGEKQTDLDSLMLHLDQYPTLDILPVGTRPPNPTELLSSPRFEQLLHEVRSHYDIILIDCPPTEILADTGIIARHADRTLFVMRAGLFDRKRVYDLEEDANCGKLKNMSVILNATSWGGRYGYKRGYRYKSYE